MDANYVNRLRELLSYCPDTGALTWKVSRGPIKKGSVAGSHNRDGYRKLMIDRKSQLAHRVAWAIHHGEWPAIDIDHVNGVKDDNRMINLRQCVDWQNRGNTIRNPGAAGRPGVRIRSRNRFCAEIVFRSNRYKLGTFANASDAGLAFEIASIFLHKEFSPYWPRCSSISAQADQKGGA